MCLQDLWPYISLNLMISLLGEWTPHFLFHSLESETVGETHDVPNKEHKVPALLERTDGGLSPSTPDTLVGDGTLLLE